MIDILIFVIFVAIVAAIVYKDRKKVSIEGLVILRRTERAKQRLDKIAKSLPLFWKVVAIIGIIVAIGGMIWGTLLIVSVSGMIIDGQVTEGIRLVLPAPTQIETIPGVILLPWWVWLLAIAIIVIPHEMMHGIMCRLEGIPIKSLGWGLFLIFPVAFVEPDEKKLQKASALVKMKVYAAGSFANLVTAVIVLFLFYLLLLSSLSITGVTPAGVITGAPLENATIGGTMSILTPLNNGIPIIEIAGQSIKSPQQLSNVLSKIPSGTEIEIKTTKESYLITTAHHPETNASFIGIAGPFRQHYSESFPGAVTLANMLYLLFILTLGVGIVNLLPAKPLDGGFIFQEILGLVIKKKKLLKRITLAASIIIAILIIFDIFGGMIMSLIF